MFWALRVGLSVAGAAWSAWHGTCRERTAFSSPSRWPSFRFKRGTSYFLLICSVEYPSLKEKSLSVNDRT